jgi:hypothetical protein
VVAEALEEEPHWRAVLRVEEIERLTGTPN